MPPMPEQNPLPFPDPPTPPSQAPKPESAPSGTAAAAGQALATLPAKPGKRPLWARLLSKLADPWLGLRIEPEAPSELIDGRPVCYVLEDYGLSNALILDRACRDAGLPSPLLPLPVAGEPLGRKRAYVALSRRRAGLVGRPKNRNHSDALSRLLMAHRLYPDQDVQLVPVSIFVGRAPTRQSGWFSVLFSENWALVGRFRRLLAILLNGRDTLVQFSPGVRVWEILGEDLPHERQVRKVSRVLRGHFRRIKTAVIGPDLSTRRLLVDRVLDAEPVRKAITDQARRDSTEYLEAWKKAHGFAWEIAADYSNPVVRSASFALTGFWNRIYGGVDVNHLDTLKQVAPGHEVIYVPSHRSHMD
ncbi:MAG TPA: glycerol-3-phosphate 1-O-acyltransferase, partial [Pseudoxanthomonas sp.]|nr:glycerol-3-phosphate 1-O-acyltransferase [Pseudoxanthomonas sp.]